MDTYENYIYKLKRTKIGRLYTGYLKRILFIRWCWQWCFHSGMIVYRYLLSRHLFFVKIKKKDWHPYIKQKEFVKREGIHVFILGDGAVVETPQPIIFPRHNREGLVQPHNRYNFPKIYGMIVDNGVICGGSNIILVGDEFICHDLYNFECDYTVEEFHSRAFIKPKRKIMCWDYSETTCRIYEAATFVDALSFNYAHWLTEVLPKISMFCSDQRFTNVPIIVNDGLHKNIVESLYLVVGSEREIIFLPNGKTLHCDKLHMISPTGYVPFEWRNRKPLHCSHGVFSPIAFDCLCNKLGEIGRATTEEVFPEKIFLRRNSNLRNLSNEKEVEDLFKTRGYAVVEPEKLTFSKQVRLFRNAKCISGSVGAAFANLIFAPKDSKISIFIAKHPDTIYWYWQNIACASGKTIGYVFGKSINSKRQGIHANFHIDMDTLTASLDGMQM